MWEKQLQHYDNLVAKCSNFERLGKTMPYTATNGYMFSLLNKAGEIGIRFSKERQEELIKKLDTTYYKSYGAVMKGYVLIPEAVLKDEEMVVSFLNESYNYFSSIEPNKHKR